MVAWNHVSASQIKTYRRCSRKWWFEKIAGFRSPSSPAAELGRAIHAELETYLLGGDRPTSPIALAGMHHLPDPSSNLLVEAELSYTKGLAVPAIGFIDLVELDNRRITDHKTTSDFKWAKTEYELAADLQAIIYSKFAGEHLFAGSGDIVFRHIYYRTRGTPASMTSQVTLTADHLEEKFQGISTSVDAMVEDSRAEEPGDVEYNPLACSDYGGCSFRGECAKLGVRTYGAASSLFAPRQKGKGEGKVVSFLDKLKKKPNSQAGKASSPPAKPKRDREQVENMIRLLSPDVTDERLAKLPMEGLLKLEKHLSAKKAKKVITAGYVNPPDGTPMDKRTEIALKEKAKERAKGKDVRLNLDGQVTTSATWEQKGGARTTDGRNIRKLSGSELLSAYWESFDQMDDAQVAAWSNSSAISSVVLRESARGDKRSKPKAKAVELRDDLRFICEILMEAPTKEDASEEYKQVQSVVAGTHMAGNSVVTQVKETVKRRRKRKTQVDRLPDELGGVKLQSIKKEDFPEVYRQVFMFYDEDLAEEWVALKAWGDSNVKQWILGGCPDKHAIKRSPMKNTLIEFLTFAETGQVASEENAEKEDAPVLSEASESTDVLAQEATASAAPDTPPPATEESGAAGHSPGRMTRANGVTKESTLYVGCMPMDEDVVFLHDYIKCYSVQVEEDAGVPHYGLIPYNEGPKRIAALMKADAYQGNLALPKSLVCDPNAPCADAVLEVLRAAYPRVVSRVW